MVNEKQKPEQEQEPEQKQEQKQEQEQKPEQEQEQEQELRALNLVQGDSNGFVILNSPHKSFFTRFKNLAL